MPEETLEPLPEDWTTGLAIVAHPDDLEYGAASAIAKWTAAGKRITYVLVTSGEAGLAIPPGGGRAAARSRGASERGGRRRRHGRVPRPSRWGDHGGPRPPARPRPGDSASSAGRGDQHQLPRLLGWSEHQHGRPPPRRHRHDRRHPRRRQPLGLPRAPRRGTRAVERRPVRVLQRLTATVPLRRHHRMAGARHPVARAAPRRISTTSTPTPARCSPTGPSTPAPKWDANTPPPSRSSAPE